MALTSDRRNALPASDFAVPGKRKLPIHDHAHVAMAWKEVDRTQGLSDEERSEARKRILRRAHELGIDTSNWTKIEAMQIVSIEAMSLNVPTEEHPNRMPFSGILVWLDHVSEKPPHGSGNRCVSLTEDCGKKAVPTLLGMGVNYTVKLDGHDAQKKIGIVDGAEVRRDGARPYIHIEGFIYASDFPDAAARIRADKDRLGLSFECRDIKLADPGADPLVVEECVFTGAAILRKDKAAFMTTKLAAHAEGEPEELDMTPEELKALLAEAMKPTNDALTAAAARLDKVEASLKEPDKLSAANETKRIEPHAKALEAAADGMECAGIGGHPERGHVAIARKMAGQLRAAAAVGQVPHIYRDHDFLASGDDKKPNADAIKEAVEAAMKPLTDKIDAQGTTITDLKAKAFTAAAQPERKTVPGELIQLLAKGGVEVKDDTKLSAAQVDKMLDAQNLSGVQRMEAKLKLQATGLLAA